MEISNRLRNRAIRLSLPSRHCLSRRLCTTWAQYVKSSFWNNLSEDSCMSDIIQIGNFKKTFILVQHHRWQEMQICLSHERHHLRWVHVHRTLLIEHSETRMLKNRGKEERTSNVAESSEANALAQRLLNLQKGCGRLKRRVHYRKTPNTLLQHQKMPESVVLSLAVQSRLQGKGCQMLAIDRTRSTKHFLLLLRFLIT